MRTEIQINGRYLSVVLDVSGPSDDPEFYPIEVQWTDTGELVALSVLDGLDDALYNAAFESFDPCEYMSEQMADIADRAHDEMRDG